MTLIFSSSVWDPLKQAIQYSFFKSILYQSNHQDWQHYLIAENRAMFSLRNENLMPGMKCTLSKLTTYKTEKKWWSKRGFHLTWGGRDIELLMTAKRLWRNIFNKCYGNCFKSITSFKMASSLQCIFCSIRCSKWNKILFYSTDLEYTIEIQWY